MRVIIAALLAVAAVSVEYGPSVVHGACYGSQFQHESCRRFVYSVHAPYPGGELSASISCEAAASVQARISVNGVQHFDVQLDSTNAAISQLVLRTGINIVSVSAAASRCVLRVEGALPLPSAGAITPYVEIEAENATATTGTLIGPDYTFLTLPSEASARMAVQIGPQQTVDFTIPDAVAGPVGAIAIRFSIPNSATGDGLTTPLDVLLNGERIAMANLTSAYSWAYGTYPFTRNPQDGAAHHFFDTVSLLLPDNVTAQPGDVVRLLNPLTGVLSAEHLLPSIVVTDGNCSVPPPNPAKVDCGFYGINQTVCESRGCCWAPNPPPNPQHVPDCYHPVAPPPPPPNPANLTITVDVVDFFTLPPPATQPPGSVSVIDHGADPTGKTDSAAAFIAAVTAGAASNTVVWVPQGQYMVIGPVPLPSNLTLVGAGPWYSSVGGRGIGFYGSSAPQPSTNVHVQGLSITGQTNVRIDTQADEAFGGALTDSVIADVAITHTKCGMWLDGPFANLAISNAWIHDTFADGVNFHRGITASTVEHSVIRNTGDDQLAMWGQQPDGDDNNTFRYNTLHTPVLANGIAIYGGSGNAALNNAIYDTLTQGGGLHVGNRFTSVPLSGTTTLANNLLVRTGQLDPNWQFGVGALWFYALDAAMSGTILVQNTTILDSPYEAFQWIATGAGGNSTTGGVSGVQISGATVHNVGSFVLQIQSAGGASVSGVVATGTQYAGVYDCPGTAFTLTDSGGNSGWNVTPVCTFPPA